MAAITRITSAVPPAPLPDMPLAPGQVAEGNPSARGAILTQSPDKLVSSGYWSCDEGEFRWDYTWDEFVHVLEGEAIVTEEPAGITHTFLAGQTACFPRGIRTRWRIVKPLTKFFVVRTPEPLK